MDKVTTLLNLTVGNHEISDDLNEVIDELQETNPEAAIAFAKLWIKNRSGEDYVDVGPCSCCHRSVYFAVQDNKLRYTCPNRKCENHDGEKGDIGPDMLEGGSSYSILELLLMHQQQSRSSVKE